jgi:pimeloyl-ACP methyl ester carboxylesterase
MPTLLTSWSSALLVGVLLACTSDPVGNNAGGGTVDGGAVHPDGGPAPLDAGQGADAAVPPYDTVECPDWDGTDAIWDPVPGDLEVPRDLGRVLSCVRARSYTRSQVSATQYFRYLGWSAENGVHALTIQYVSQGPAGVPRRVTASVVVPSDVVGPFPLVTVGHGTTGMGPACGVTHDPDYVNYLALPLAGRGFAVVATDYAGMGVDDGVSPYLVGEGEAFNVLDAARAARRLHTALFDGPSDLSGDLLVLGHSQGGHAALFAHQHFHAAEGLRVLGTVAIAPGVGTQQGMGPFIATGTRPTDFSTVATTMSLYAAHHYFGGVALADWLTPGAAAQVPGLLHDDCLDALLTSLPRAFPTHADLFTASFRTAASGCLFDGSPCPAFEPWASWINAAVPGDFSSTVPVMVIQGLQDTTVPPATTACIVDRLRARATPVQACAYPRSDHVMVALDAMGDAVAWMRARLDGGVLPPCAAELTATCP